jgi:hypothetical protein
MFSVDSVELPVPAGSNVGYGSAVRSLGDGTFVTTWIEGSASFRLARVDAYTGSAAVLKGVRGLLRDVFVDPDRDRVWLLCTHGLHEVSREPFKIVRTLTKGLGTYNYTLTPIRAGTVAVSKRFGQASAVVSLAEMKTIGRLTVTAPEATIHLGDRQLLLSFAAESGRLLDPDGKVAKKVYRLPLGTTPVVIGTSAIYLPGTRRPPNNSSRMPDDFDVDRYSTVAAHGTVAVYDAGTEQSTVISAGGPLRSLFGTDGSRRLVASDTSPAAPGRRFILASSADGRPAGSAILATPVQEAILIGDYLAVVSPRAGLTAPQTFTRIGWSAAWPSR